MLQFKRGGILKVWSRTGPLSDRERAILERSGAECDPIIIEALRLFDARIVA